ncbi:MAG TPA: hypothetical protein VKW78_05535 [Terriglobales bacterium]|nr:hypothetical protein [Terriglobales bacterium]
MGRAFSFLSILLVLAGGMYIYSRQVKAISPTVANNPKSTVNLVGVRMDLNNIANAERRYLATEGKYASLDELISGQYITDARLRGPYSYDVQVSGDGFVVTATRAPGADPGLPAQMSIDQNMQQSSN